MVFQKFFSLLVFLTISLVSLSWCGSDTKRVLTTADSSIKSATSDLATETATIPVERVSSLPIFQESLLYSLSRDFSPSLVQSSSSEEPSSSSSRVLSPTDSQGSEKSSPKSIMRFSGRRKTVKKQVQWHSEVEEIVPVALEGKKDDVSGVSIIATESLESQEEVEPQKVSCFKKSCSLSYQDCINLKIIMAVEDACEQKNKNPLLELSREFESLLVGSNDSEKEVLERALIELSKKIDTTDDGDFSVVLCSDEPSRKMVPLKNPQAISEVFKKKDVDPSKERLKGKIVPVAVALGKPVEETLLPKDNEFEKVLSDIINTHDQDLLEDLKRNIFDSDSEQYARIEKALSQELKEDEFEAMFAEATDRRNTCALEKLKSRYPYGSQQFNRIAYALHYMYQA